MENRELARLLGALCFEERLRLIGDLIAAGNEGLTQHELSEITGIAPRMVYTNLDYMESTGMVKRRPTATGNKKTSLATHSRNRWRKDQLPALFPYLFSYGSVSFP